MSSELRLSWTAGIGTWWPPDHTMTGRAEAVVLQGGVGGRIYERTADGGPLLEELGLAEVSHDARNNRMRAI